MKRFISCALFLACSLIAIDGLYAQGKNRKAHPHELGEDIYKHYTGTIGSNKVTLDLRYGYRGGSNYGGSMYYTIEEKTPTTLMIFEPASYDHGVAMTAQEYSVAADFTDRKAKHKRWSFVIGDKNLTGTWYNTDSSDSAHIDLAEDYTQSYPMDLVAFNDQLPGIENVAIKSATAGPLVHLIVVLSISGKKEDAAYINGESLRFLGESNIGSLTRSFWRSYPGANAREHFKQLTTADVSGAVAARLTLIPVYNDNEMLVLRRTEGDYGTEEISYLCLDVRNRKRWTFNDILSTDNDTLVALLEKVIRAQYQLAPGDKLNTILSVNKIPVSRNVAVVRHGLYFTYRMGEIAAKDKINDDINLFIPYSQLRPLLTAQFKKRMGL